jgi:hypothetical protein
VIQHLPASKRPRIQSLVQEKRGEGKREEERTGERRKGRGGEEREKNKALCL